MIAVMVKDPRERELPPVGLINLRDAETGEDCLVDTSDSNLRQRYREEAKREEEEQKLKGEVQKAEWGKQIRSYVMQPYKMGKDHRTNYETQAIDKVLDGDLGAFAESYLRYLAH